MSPLERTPRHRPVFVTGDARFIGCYMARQSALKGEKAIIGCESKAANAPDLIISCGEWFPADLAASHFITRLFTGPAIIFQPDSAGCVKGVVSEAHAHRHR